MCAYYSPHLDASDPAASPLEFSFKTVTTFHDKQGARLASMLQTEQLEEAGFGRKARKRQSNLSDVSFAKGGGGGDFGGSPNPPNNANRKSVHINDSPPNCLVRSFRRCMAPVVRCLKKHVLPIPIDHDLYMTSSIWSRARRYRHIPYFFIVNMLLCGLLFGYIETYQLFISDYVVQSRYALSSMIVGADDETDSSLRKEMKDITEVKAFVMDWVEGYYSIPMDSSGVFQHFADPDDHTEIRRPRLELKYASDRSFSHFITLGFDLTEDDPLGPLANVSKLTTQNETCRPETDFDGNQVIPCRNDTVADFFDLFVSASIAATIRGVVANPAYTYASSLRWSFSTQFIFESHNSQLVAKTSLDYIETQRMQTAPVYVVVVIGLLSMYGIVSKLNWWARHSEYPKFAKSEGHIRKYKTAMRWNFYGVFADTVSLTFSIYALTTGNYAFLDYSHTQWKCVILGSAAFVQVLFIVSHFQNVARMYVIAQSIGNALPNLGAYFVSVFPMFFGFCVCASAAFGGLSNLFESLPLSMVTFFSMVGGDSLLDIYTAANVTTDLPLQIFTGILIGGFIIFFIGCMLNMMLAIVQDSYQVGRALNDMDEKVMREIRREDAERALLDKSYTEARKSGLDGWSGGGGGGGGKGGKGDDDNHGNDKGGRGGGSARKAFKAAMVGVEGGGDIRQQSRYEAFTPAELMSLRKRFFVQPRRNVGIDLSSSSDSDNSDASGAEGDDALAIDHNLRKALVFEQKQKLRMLREDNPTLLINNSSSVRNSFNQQGQGGGGRPYSPRASTLSQGLRRGVRNADFEGESAIGMDSHSSDRRGGGFGGSNSNSNSNRHSNAALPRSNPRAITAARAHGRTLDDFHVVEEDDYYLPNNGYGSPDGGHAYARGDQGGDHVALHEINSVDTEYLLSTEGYNPAGHAMSLGTATTGRSLGVSLGMSAGTSYGRGGGGAGGGGRGGRPPASFYNRYEAARASRLGAQGPIAGDDTNGPN